MESENSSELDFYYKIGDDDNHNPRYQSGKFSVEYPSEAIKAYEGWLKEYNISLDTVAKNSIQAQKERIRSLFVESNNKLNEWFENITIGDKSLQEIIENELEKTSKLRLIIETKQEEIQKLFWHQLKILKNEHKKKVGVVFTIPDLHPKSISLPEDGNNSKVLKILIIFGVNPEHKPQEHHQKWEEWKTKLEEQYNLDPSSKSLDIQIEQSPQEYDSLLKIVTKNDYHIVYFTGHGTSPSVEFVSENEETIKLCEHIITVDQFYDLLSPSNNINQQLVILNCCEGLTVAKNLLQNGVLQVLCIREKISLEDSKKFLQKLLSKLPEAGDTHLAHHQAQLDLSLANNSNSYYGSCSITALFHQAKTVPPILPTPTPPSPTPPTWLEKLIRKIKELPRWVLISGSALGLLIILLLGYLLGVLHKGVLDSNDQRRKDALEYTVDVQSKNQHFTGTFVDKSENDSTSDKKYTYKVALPIELQKDIEGNQKLTIKTNKGETFQIYNTAIEYGQDPFPEGYPAFLMVSFQSDKEYNFPEIETEALKELLSPSVPSIPLIEDTRVLLFKKEPNSPVLFDPIIGVLIAKQVQERQKHKDKKFLYYGYAKDSDLVKSLQQNVNLIEINTFKNEQFNNDQKSEQDQEGWTQLPENASVSGGFNIANSSDGQYIFFSFTSDKEYQCFKIDKTIESLDDLAKNYHEYLPSLKKSK